MTTCWTPLYIHEIVTLVLFPSHTSMVSLLIVGRGSHFPSIGPVSVEGTEITKTSGRSLVKTPVIGIDSFKVGKHRQAQGHDAQGQAARCTSQVSTFHRGPSRVSRVHGIKDISSLACSLGVWCSFHSFSVRRGVASVALVQGVPSALPFVTLAVASKSSIYACTHYCQ